MSSASASSPGSEMGPLVSIVVPTYNRAHLLPVALDSCLGQTYRNIEVVVVNDGSRDNTEEVLRSYEHDSRVRVIHKANGGIPETVNLGFSAARGGYVTWTSDDNRYHADAIETMVAFMEAHTDVGMCYTDVNDVDASFVVIRVVDTGAPDRLDPRRSDAYCGVRGCLLLRREVVESVGPWDRRWVRTHDFDFYIRVYQKYRVTHLPVVLYDYMCHDASMTGNYEAIAIEEARLLESCCPGAHDHTRIWAPRYVAIARWFEKRGDRRHALFYYWKAGRLDSRHWALVVRALEGWFYGLVPAFARRVWRWLKSCSRR